MKVLMFGWEFPPVYSGGLGTACYGLTKALAKKGVEITFVMPQGPLDIKGDFVNLLIANNLAITNITIKKVASLLSPYSGSEDYYQRYQKIMQTKGNAEAALYGYNLHHEVYRFSEIAKLIAESEDFDVIHCHDWMTFPAGINAKQIKNKPLIVHIHATEFDRTGGNGVNQYVYDLEKTGMQLADMVIANSHHTKHLIINHYGIPPEKITVIHNAVDFSDGNFQQFRIRKEDKLVLFLGRITLQKGPDYFIEAAKMVLEKDPDVKFIVVGSGDMEAAMIQRAAQLGIGSKVLFAGFLKGEERDRIYKMADVYVMPSVSEPFGITPLEAMVRNTPTIISKQSGVSEVLRNCLKVDFWDVEELANKILGVLTYRHMHNELTILGYHEVLQFSWDFPADKCIELYDKFGGRT
ncbi:glycosyltransferase family 1 protein [Candidatus Woesearchaeota archaeon]|nr:MAG: glycosyltransferase family 1 protein [Candidatus Woesearchaeota archaeon]